MASTSKNHQKAPECSKFVNAMRDAFGSDVEVLYVKENDLEMGAPTEQGAPCFHCTSAEVPPEPKRKRGAR